MGFNWILLFESYNYTSVAVSTVCYYMAPVFVILAAPVFFKEKLTLKKIICATVAFTGILLVSGIFKTSFTGINEIKGVLFGLAAAVLYASVILINKKLTSIESFDRTILQLGTSAIVLFPYTMMTENLSRFPGKERKKTAPCAMHRVLLKDELFRHEGQQSHMTGALDRGGQLTLMLGAGAGSTAGQDLATLGHQATQLSSVLVIDIIDLVDAETANLLTLAASDSIVSH